MRPFKPKDLRAPAGPPPPPPPVAPSDIRLKTDIRRVGSTVHDLPLYSYRYKAGGGPQIGVMAQDVVKVVPDAVVTSEDGYFAVDYGMLGLEALAIYNAERASAPVPMGPPPPPPPLPPSDIRLKADISPLGATVHGLPLYSFRYKTGGGLQVGVMAHEVMDVAPDAVSVREDGFYCVDYERLGLGALAASNASRVR